MMTPRGVADVHGLHARARRGALRHPPGPGSGLHRTEGRHVGQHPGDPGIGDKTAGQLIAQYGSLEEVIEHADELSPARRKNIARARRPGAGSRSSSRRCAEISTSTATRRARAPAARPLGAARDVPALRVPQPARARSTSSTRPSLPQPMSVQGTEVAVARGELPRCAWRGFARDPRRRVCARSGRRGVIVGAWGWPRAPPRRRGADRARLQGAAAADDGTG